MGSSALARDSRSYRACLRSGFDPDAADGSGAEPSCRVVVRRPVRLSGIRRDLGQTDAALVALQIPELKKSNQPRLAYAYADTLLGLGRTDEAREWFQRAADADSEYETDAVERLEELDGVSSTDLLGGEEDEVDE